MASHEEISTPNYKKKQFQNKNKNCALNIVTTETPVRYNSKTTKGRKKRAGMDSKNFESVFFLFCIILRTSSNSAVQCSTRSQDFEKTDAAARLCDRRAL